MSFLIKSFEKFFSINNSALLFFAENIIIIVTGKQEVLKHWEIKNM
jgi:hypothetical protein